MTLAANLVSSPYVHAVISPDAVAPADAEGASDVGGTRPVARL
jgi:hypothetical protein